MFTRDAALEIVLEQFPEPITIKSLTEKLGCSVATSHSRLHELASEDDGRLKEKTVAANGVVFWVNPEHAIFEAENLGDYPDVEPGAVTGFGHEEKDLFDEEFSEEVLLEAIASAWPEPITLDGIGKRAGSSKRTVQNKIDELVDSGAVQTMKPSSRGRVFWVEHPNVRYSPAEASRDDITKGLKPAQIVLCPACERPIKSRHGLTAHIEANHPDLEYDDDDLVRAYMCDPCEKVFDTAHGFRVHSGRMHQE